MSKSSVRSKHGSLSWMEWFSQMPTDRKVIGCVAAITGSLLSRVLYCKLHRKWNNYPPGPIGLPLIGYLHKFDIGEPSFYEEMDAEHRGMVLLYLGMTPFLFINDAEILKDVFVRSPEIRDFRAFSVSLKQYAVPLNSLNGSLWRKRKKMVHSTFAWMTRSNYIDTMMKALMTDFVFPSLDKKAAEYTLSDDAANTHYFCREDVKWFGFAFLFGVFFGVDSDIPGLNDPEFKRFMKLDESGLGAFAKHFVLSLGWLSALLLDKLYVFEPFDKMGNMLRDWHRKCERKDGDTYFDRMTERMEEGLVTV